MTEQELRAIVRDAVSRRLGQGQGEGHVQARIPGSESQVLESRSRPLHPSHGIYLNLVNVGGECVIEPNVTCNHCNYCKSHGH
jgi:hypothetical protein